MLYTTLPLSNLRLVPLFEFLLEPLQIAVSPSCIGDDVISGIRVLGDDGIVNDTAVGVEENRQS